MIMNDTSTFLYHDKITGEYFFVEEETPAKAWKIATKWFDAPRFIRAVDYFEAEMLGYDTY